MGLSATEALKIRQSGQSALQLLDMICLPYKGCDAEFEAEDPSKRGHINPAFTFYTDPPGPLGKLIAEAFAPERDWIGDWIAWCNSSDFGNEGNGNVRDMWEDSGDYPECPMAQFSRRYDFC
jgi:hypothetical protein